MIKLLPLQSSARVASMILQLYDWCRSVSAALHMMYLLDLIMYLQLPLASPL